MSEMVERVACAICWSERPHRWPKCPCEGKCDYARNSAVSEPKARAAMEAMRAAFLAEPLVAIYNIAPGCLNNLFDEALR